MGTLLKGLHELKGAYVGSSEVQKIYKGDTLVWKALPYNSEIEYLESTGTQWIDTGIYLKGTDTVSITYSNITRETASHMLFGTYGYGGKQFCMNAYNTSNQWYWYYNSTQASFNLTIDTADGSVHTLMMGNNTYKFDNNSAVSMSQSTSFTCTSNCCIFNTLPNTGYPIKMRCYSFLIVDSNGNTLRDMIPVRVGSVGYMYDKVSKQLFGNAGSGNFTLGPDIS